ncbi:hypothetical protein OEZ86_007125 [Tetradesmus obliquus]|nr:hypothetical protein OEZ86_007125 [Tetradesmus obliquus]
MQPPACIKADFPQARVLSVSYNSTAANWTGCEVLSGQGSWAHVAAAVCQHLADPTFKVDPPLGDAPLFLVGHSLGGLLIKQLCLELKKQADNQSGGNNYSKVFDSIHGAVFYATPHMGSWFGNHAERLLCCLPCFKQSSVLPLLHVFSQETAEINAAFHNMPFTTCATHLDAGYSRQKAWWRLHHSTYLTLRSFINHEMGRPRPREHNGSAAVAGSSSAAAGPAAAAAAPAAAGSDQPAAGGSSSARQQLWIAPGRAVELQVFDLQVDIVSDQVPWKRVGQLQCIIQSAPSDTESSFTCELCGTIPVGDNFWLNSSSGSGFEADLSLTAAIGPAVSPQFVEVLSLSLADLDVMVRSKFHGDLYSNELCVTVVSSRKPFQLTDHLHGTLQWAWLVRHEAYSVNSKVELTWVELALGGISRTWQRGEQM